MKIKFTGKHKNDSFEVKVSIDGKEYTTIAGVDLTDDKSAQESITRVVKALRRGADWLNRKKSLAKYTKNV